MKYIIIQTEFKLPAAIIFHECLQHDDIAGEREVLGAGFCNPKGDVWGFSKSLEINSKPEDSAYIKLALNFNL